MLKGEKIGEGTYGKVYAARSRLTKEKYAVKRNFIEIPLDFAGSIRELDLLTTLQDHPHIIRIEFMSIGDPFVHACLSPLRTREYKDDKIHFIFPFADGDLDSLIRDHRYTPAKAQEYMVQILLAVEYMHSKGIVHRDLKPQNVLTFKDTMQVCDFGLAKPLGARGPHSPRVVTSWYRAPEIILGNAYYDYKVDVWSIGCIMFELITKTPFINNIDDKNRLLIDHITTRFPKPVESSMFTDMCDKGSMGRIRQKERKRRKTWEQQLFAGSKPANFDKDAFLDLLPNLLSFDPQDRWTVTEVLEHRFFDNHRRYINEIRRDFPPEPDPISKIKCIHCNERTWAISMAYVFFNDRSRYEWYSHRILFQGIDIFDRYLLHLDATMSPSRQNNTKGIFMDKYRACLSFLVCMYLSIKYFVGAIYPVSFKEICEPEYRTLKARKIADELETQLIKEILGYHIYRPTIFDITKTRLTDYQVIDLLYVTGELYHLDPSLTIVEARNAFLTSLKRKSRSNKKRKVNM